MAYHPDAGKPVSWTAQADIIDGAKIQTEMVRRVISDPSIDPAELAGFFEEVAHRYLEISRALRLNFPLVTKQ